MSVIEFSLTVIAIHLMGGLLWFIFFMGHMLTNPKEKKVFQQLVNNGSSKRYSPSFVRATLILTVLGVSLVKWEVSAYRTFKKSYKNFLPKK